MGARQLLATGRIDRKEFMRKVIASTPSTGYCNTMGTAATMNNLAEALGMTLPGSAAIPAPHPGSAGDRIPHRPPDRRDGVGRSQPSDILTREAFINAVRVNSRSAARRMRPFT